MAVSANEALVRRAIEAIWNNGDFDVADEVFAADYTNHAGLITDLVLGPEAVKVSAALYRVAFPGLHVSVEELNTVGDTVVLKWTARSSLERDSKSLTGITRARIAAGKIGESWTDWNQIGALVDLGLSVD
jgi:SnoaL-like polyketide cyclase